MDYDTNKEYESFIVKDIISKLKKSFDRLSKMFLLSGLFTPFIYVLMIYFMYKYAEIDEIFNLLLILFISVATVSTITLILLSYRYKKMIGYDDERLKKTSFYKNYVKSYYDIIYIYNNHKIIIKNTYDTSTLLIDDIEQDKYNGYFQKSFKLQGNINGNKIVGRYKMGIIRGGYTAYFNGRKIEDEYKEIKKY